MSSSLVKLAASHEWLANRYNQVYRCRCLNLYCRSFCASESDLQCHSFGEPLNNTTIFAEALEGVFSAMYPQPFQLEPIQKRGLIPKLQLDIHPHRTSEKPPGFSGGGVLRPRAGAKPAAPPGYRSGPARQRRWPQPECSATWVG